MSGPFLPKGNQPNLYPGLPAYNTPPPGQGMNNFDPSHWARDAQGEVVFCNCPLMNGICEKTYQNSPSTLKCECGSDATWGENEDPKAHSSWCPKGAK